MHVTTLTSCANTRCLVHARANDVKVNFRKHVMGEQSARCSNPCPISSPKWFIGSLFSDLVAV